MNRNELPRKRVGDIMYRAEGVEYNVLAIVGQAVMERMPKVIEILTDGGFNVTFEVVKECLLAKYPSYYQNIVPKNGEIPVSVDDAATISCPSIDAQINKRVEGLNEFLVKDATDKLNAIKAKALSRLVPMSNRFGEKLGNATNEINYLLQIVELKDGQLQYISDYKERLTNLTAVHFKTQAAVDIYNQHVTAFEEMQKLYGLVRNNFVRVMHCTPDIFIQFDAGEIGFPCIDYEVLAKKSN